MKIGRTLFWFKDGNDVLLSLNERFFGLGTLMNRLLNEVYKGPSIKFINVDFATEKTYVLNPILPKEKPYYYGGHLTFYGLFDRSHFDKLQIGEQASFLWNRAFEYLTIAAKSIPNEKLQTAVEYAYKKGFAIDLNPDYRLVEASVSLLGHSLKASIWVNFRENEMISKLILEEQGKTIYEQEIDHSKNGVEFFLEMYKDIEVIADSIVIKGRKDAANLPMKIPLEKIISHL
jgi:hypothetical protein